MPSKASSSLLSIAAGSTSTTTAAASTPSHVSTATSLTPTTSSTTFTVSIPTAPTTLVPTSTPISSNSIANSFPKPMSKSVVNSTVFIDLTLEEDKKPTTADALPDAGATDTSTKSSKRSLSDTSTASNAKKMKVQESDGDFAVPKGMTVALNAGSCNDLKQMYLMKINEIIRLMSEITELRQQRDVMEQMLKMERKKVLQLMKRAQDRKIATKRLLHQKRLKNKREKLLIPVKSTRSVGLQVRLDSNIMSNVRMPNRKINTPHVTNTITSATQNNTNIKKPIKFVTIPGKSDTTVANKMARPKQRKVKGKPFKSSKSLLRRALVNATIQTWGTTPPVPISTPIARKSKANLSPKRMPKSAVNSKVFIDLTKEDIKKPTTAGQANGVHTSFLTGSSAGVSNTAVRDGQVQPVKLSNPATTIRNTTAKPKPVSKHSAPLPLPPASKISLPACKPVPPKPHLSIRRSRGGVVLSWKMPYNLNNYESIASYQLYTYQGTTSPSSLDKWRKVGDIEALALPMTCTLTQFACGSKYYFVVRAVDVQKRMGPFSDPKRIRP